jgi:hypothetical protein
MVRLGMARLLAERGVDVAVEWRMSELLIAAQALSPDVIVLPLDGEDETEVGRARAAAPAAKLILWALDESEMHVYDAGRAVPRRVSAGMPGALLSEFENDPTTLRGN